ncbi:MAG TPA: tripartite tricarboxylate transporter substrate binding protein [Burkholderiales bacterium]|nr:tripartite tricarboxylate transporter substrate binding protein [Burkholderiales bacterium]
MKSLATFICVATGAAFGTLATAQTSGYPNRPIRMIAPSSAGGPVDVIARAISASLSEVLGQQIVIDNRAGAAGLIGAEIVAKSTPDGYTLLMGFSGPLAIVPHLVKSVPYDTNKDFAPITLAASAPYVLLVHPSLPVKSVKDLIDLAKSQPGKLLYASGGTGVGIHMAGELFNLAAGVKIIHVPYKGAGPGMTALLAGEVNMMFNGLSAALPQVKAGRLRALAVGGDKRSALLPELPTVAESGLQFNTSGWYGVLGPAGLPRALVTRLRNDTLRALAAPDTKERLSALAVEVIGSTPEAFATQLRQEYAQWGKVVKAAGLTPQ